MASQQKLLFGTFTFKSLGHFSVHILLVVYCIYCMFTMHHSIACSSTKSLDDVELADRRLFTTAVLVKPLPVGCAGQDGTVLTAASIRLMGDLWFPVLKAYWWACLVSPLALLQYVIYTQPDVPFWPDGLPDVLVQLVVLIARKRAAECSTFCNAVIVCHVKGLLHRVCKKTFAWDLDAFQANWREKERRTLGSNKSQMWSSRSLHVTNTQQTTLNSTHLWLS